MVFDAPWPIGNDRRKIGKHQNPSEKTYPNLAPPGQGESPNQSGATLSFLIPHPAPSSQLNELFNLPIADVNHAPRRHHDRG